MTRPAAPSYTTTIRDPRFGADTDRLLARLGDPAPLDHETLLAARASTPDPSLAGVADPNAHISELYLPLRSGPCRARLYTGPQPADRPLLLWLHGGAFVGGSPRDLDAVCSVMAVLGEITVVSLDYRLAPEHPYPAALEDTDDAMGWLIEHGRTIGGNGHVVAGGQSAGACLVAGATLRRRDQRLPSVDAQILCYPSLDFGQNTESAREFDGVVVSTRPGQWREAAYLGGQRITPYAAPLRADTLTDLPPCLVIGAGRDPLRDDARSWAARLYANGIDVEHVEYEATMHAFLNFYAAHAAAPHAAKVMAHHLREQWHRRGR